MMTNVENAHVPVGQLFFMYTPIQLYDFFVTVLFAKRSIKKRSLT